MNGRRNEHKKVVGLFSVVILSIVVAVIGISSIGAMEEVSVTRGLPNSVATNEQFTVTLTQTGFFMNLGRVSEELPPGFQYVNGSYTGGAPNNVSYNTTTRTLQVWFRDEQSISYAVTASSYTQTAVFNGTYRFINETFKPKEGTVTGDETVTVIVTPTPTPGVTRWDINEDCTVNYIDLAILSAHWDETTTAPYPRYDINADGKLNYIDLAMLSAHWGESTC